MQRSRMSSVYVKEQVLIARTGPYSFCTTSTQEDVEFSVRRCEEKIVYAFNESLFGCHGSDESELCSSHPQGIWK